MRRRKKSLSQQDLQAAGVSAGLMVRRYGADGRARLEQLSPESFERRQSFARRLTQDSKDTPTSEGSKTA
jgi:hypothetical protein